MLQKQDPGIVRQKLAFALELCSGFAGVTLTYYKYFKQIYEHIIVNLHVLIRTDTCKVMFGKTMSSKTLYREKFSTGI